jgi:hypothetical protein
MHTINYFIVTRKAKENETQLPLSCNDVLMLGVEAYGGERARLEAAIGAAISLADWEAIERKVVSVEPHHIDFIAPCL